MIGSWIPFANTKAERLKTGDLRLSLEERYASRADYQRKVEEAASKLVQQRFLLAEHVKTIVQKAGEHWDWATGQANQAALTAGTH
jgi:hypothetical protein